jgi:hypothetical protein
MLSTKDFGWLRGLEATAAITQDIGVPGLFSPAAKSRIDISSPRKVSVNLAALFARCVSMMSPTA